MAVLHIQKIVLFISPLEIKIDQHTVIIIADDSMTLMLYNHILNSLYTSWVEVLP